MTDIKNKVEVQPSNELDTLNSDQTTPDQPNLERPNLEQPNRARRNALLGAATGASLVAWHKPIISSMMLPAHAQTSAPTATTFFGSNVTAGPLVKASDSILNFLVPEAIAGGAALPPYSVSVVPAGTSGENFTISVFEDLGATQGFDLAQVIYSGQVSVSGGGTLDLSENPCGLTGLPGIQVEIAEIGANSVVLNFTNRSQSITVPAGDGSLPTPMCTDGAVALNFSIEDFDPQLLGVTKSESSILDILVPAAHAGVELQIIRRTYTINAAETSAGSGEFDITILERIENPDSQLNSVLASTFMGTVPSSGASSLSLLSAGCDEAPMGTISVEIRSVSESSLELDVNSREFSVSLKPGSVMIGSPTCVAFEN